MGFLFKASDDNICHHHILSFNVGIMFVYESPMNYVLGINTVFHCCECRESVQREETNH